MFSISINYIGSLIVIKKRLAEVVCLTGNILVLLPSAASDMEGVLYVHGDH